MSLGSDAARPALRPLIEAFQVVHLRPVRADLLRALAALCSSADIIQEFETVRLNIAFIVGSFDIQSKPIGSGRQPDRKKKKKKPLLQQCQCLMFGFFLFLCFLLQCGGLAVVFDILCNPRSQADSEEKSEAAGLLAQITSPWLDPPMEDAQAGIICGTSNGSSNGGDLQQPNPNGAWPTLHLTPYISSFIAALTGK